MSRTALSMMSKRTYGTEDSSFEAAGGEEGLRELVDDFYEAMSTLPEARRIRGMHPINLTAARDKLARFLSGWMNGPNTYVEKYGRIIIPHAHRHLDIGDAEIAAWLKCMEVALDKQDYEPDFKSYLLQQLARPAERCRTREG